MKFVFGTVLISVELIFTVQAAIFKRYSVINGTKASGTGRTVPGIEKGLTCFLECEKDADCTAVNHNEDDKTCELLYGQSNELFSLKTAVEWTACINLKDVDLLSNAVASQSSTMSSASASRAIDGNTNGDYSRGSCTHTQSTGIRWWMVDFGNQFSVSSVILWNRLDMSLWSMWARLRYLRLTVGNSLQALNNDFSVCGTYTGPPSSERDNPVRIDCVHVMYGRYLKIEKYLPNDEPLTLCEVEVVQ